MGKVKAIVHLVRQLKAKFKGEPYLGRLVERGLIIGNNCSIRDGVIIDPSHCWHIKIGNNVTLAPRVHILAHDASTYLHLGYTRIGKVNIEDNVFIGAGSIIMPHVTIGENSIIGAGSLVNKDIPANVVAAGNPARVICSLQDFLAKNREQMQRLPCFGEEYRLSRHVTATMREEMNQKMVEGQGYVV